VDPIKMKKDRMFDPQRINLYVYVRNNPFKYVDVAGEDLIPANAKAAQQLSDDLKTKLSPAEFANLKIVAGKNIEIINQNFVSTSPAYQTIIQAASTVKRIKYFSVPQGSSVRVKKNLVIPWDDSKCTSACQTVQAGTTVPIDTNSLTTANRINIYVPEAGGVITVLDQNGQLIPFTRELMTFHEIAHGNCGHGQCAVSIENQIRNPTNSPSIPIRSGTDHESIPSDSVQTSSVSLKGVTLNNVRQTTPLQPETTTGLQNLQPTFRQPQPLLRP
jgi:hypothetical protein